MDTTHASKAFHEGARVGRSGLSPSLNPYRDDDSLQADWMRGWYHGRDERAANAMRLAA